MGRTPIPGGTGTITRIAGGMYHNCAIKTDGTPACWGANFQGQITIPAGAATVTALDAGERHTCAVNTGGVAFCWGLGSNGQLGGAADITSASPSAPAGANPYSHTITSGGSPAPSFAVTSGTLPAGLSLDATSGEITGTATTPGTATGTITASNGVFADDTQPFSILVEFDAPSTTDNVPAGWVGGDVTVTLTAGDTGGSGVGDVYYTTDGTTPTTSSPTYDALNKPVLGDAQRVRYFAIDQAGNQEPVQTSAAVRVDTGAPSASITTPADGATYELGQSVAAAYSCADPASGVDACTGPVRAGDPIDTSTAGIHTFRVIASDAAGNTSATMVDYTITQSTVTDTIAPAILIPARNRTITASSAGVRFPFRIAREAVTGTIALKRVGRTFGTADFSAANGEAAVARIRLTAVSEEAPREAPQAQGTGDGSRSATRPAT